MSGGVRMSNLKVSLSNGLPKNVQCLTSYALKMIAIVFMVGDHIHQMFYMHGAPLWFTMAGRIVMPLFLFMLSEGYHYTRDKKKYMLRLLIAFWVMSIGNQLLSSLLPLDGVVLMNSMFGTMFLAVYYMWQLDSLVTSIKAKNITKTLLSIGGILLPIIATIPMLYLELIPLTLLRLYLIFIPTVLTVETGIFGIILALGFRYLRNYRWLQVLWLVLFTVPFFVQGDFQWMMVFAAIPILLYNGKPGRKSKYFFYIFYPAHIYLLYMISYFMK